MNTTNEVEIGRCLVHIAAGRATLVGDLTVPAGATGLVLFAHGSGSSRHSPRNRLVASSLQAEGLATLLLDLLTPAEDVLDAHTGRLRFDIGLLAERLAGAVDWLRLRPETRALPVGLFGASTGAAAALVAAAEKSELVGAVVSRGGRPDLAGAHLRKVRAPTLLIVGGDDWPVIGLNEQALRELASAEKRLVIVPGASHLFEEPGTLEEVARLAGHWFGRFLGRPTGAQRP
jgi:dienelactone hydrolase